MEFGRVLFRSHHWRAIGSPTQGPVGVARLMALRASNPNASARRFAAAMPASVPTRCARQRPAVRRRWRKSAAGVRVATAAPRVAAIRGAGRSEEHTSELQSLMRISYAVFCLKKKTDKEYKNQTSMTKRTIQMTE